MDYVTLLEAAVSRQQFRLHPALDANKYQLTNNMRDAPTKWKAYCYMGFDATDPKNSIHEGDMSPVGYVMISLKDNTIIPISRGDEHHKGYELLRDLSKWAYKKKKELINPDDYLPIWCHGSNYIYSKSEIPNLLIALKKYLSYGGKDGPLNGTYELKDVLMSLSQFVERDGNTELTKNTLNPMGERFFNGFVKLADDIRAARNSHSPSLTGKAFQTATKLAAELRTCLWYLNLSDTEYAILVDPKIISSMRKEEDGLRQLEEAFFGFSGVKNNIHNKLREYLVRQSKGEVDNWNDPQIKALWGNVELAVDKLGSI